jgi:cyclophilin family peptidyl-prolyl cis-trans isomerase
MEEKKINFGAVFGLLVLIIAIVGVIYMFAKTDIKVPAVTSNTDSYGTNTVTIPKTSTSSATTSSTNSPITMSNTVTIETNKGTIVIETYPADAPKAAANFVALAQKKFYDGVIFHRVIKGFMIQGGDPTGTGRGGPGYVFADELNPATPSYKTGYVRGVVAMANSGPNTNGSQFFIMHQNYPLPNNYTIFGHVVSGMDVVDAIANSPVNGEDRPVQDVVMKSVTVASK